MLIEMASVISSPNARKPTPSGPLFSPPFRPDVYSWGQTEASTRTASVQRLLWHAQTLRKAALSKTTRPTMPSQNYWQRPRFCDGPWAFYRTRRSTFFSFRTPFGPLWISQVCAFENVTLKFLMKLIQTSLPSRVRGYTVFLYMYLATVRSASPSTPLPMWKPAVC